MPVWSIHIWGRLEKHNRPHSLVLQQRLTNKLCHQSCHTDCFLLKPLCNWTVSNSSLRKHTKSKFSDLLQSPRTGSLGSHNRPGPAIFFFFLNNMTMFGREYYHTTLTISAVYGMHTTKIIHEIKLPKIFGKMCKYNTANNEKYCIPQCNASTTDNLPFPV